MCKTWSKAVIAPVFQDTPLTPCQLWRKIEHLSSNHSVYQHKYMSDRLLRNVTSGFVWSTGDWLSCTVAPWARTKTYEGVDFSFYWQRSREEDCTSCSVCQTTLGETGFHFQDKCYDLCWSLYLHGCSDWPLFLSHFHYCVASLFVDLFFVSGWNTYFVIFHKKLKGLNEM